MSAARAPNDHHLPGLLKLEHEVAVAVQFVARAWGGAAVIAFLVLALWRGLPQYQFAEQWETVAQLAALAVAIGGYALAWRWEGAGGAMLLVAAAVPGSLAAVEFAPPIAFAACAAFLVPGLLFLLHWQRTHSPVALALLAAAVAGLLAAGGVAAARVYDYYYGPTHPESDRAPFAVDLVHWAWSGAVTANAFTVKAKRAVDGPLELLVSDDAVPGQAPRRVAASAVSESGVLTFVVDGLRPATRYRYTFALGERMDVARTGAVTTFPEGAASFTIAIGACSRTGSNGLVYERILEANPLLFLVTGDFHYKNIRRNDPDAFREAFETNLSRPAQQALYLATPFAYTWDDHDWSGNDSDRTAKSGPAAHAVYREYVPHYPLAPGERTPIAQAFTIGRVRFIVTDSRSARDPASERDGPGKSMLGEGQKAWLKEQLLAANGVYPLIVWVNGVPWIGEAEEGGDDWSGYASERRELADFIVEHDIRGLAMVSGDPHMLAIDDGTHNVFASDGRGPGFPVLQSAALDRRGKTKGGPYTSGMFPGGGHYALMTVTDDGGDTVTVHWSGRTWRGEELVSHTFRSPR